MEARVEFEQLMAALCDGPSETTRNCRLNTLLREHPEWQPDYIDHMQLHALLRWRGGATCETRTTAPAGTRRRWRLRATAAALAALAVGLGLVFFLAPASEAQAAHEVVGQLVDWDLDISQAQSLEVRRAIHTSRDADLKALMLRTKFQPEDRELADSLVETGSWLTRNDDPVAEAERFADIADRVLARLDSPDMATDGQPAMRLAESYRRIAQVGVSGNLDRIAGTMTFDPPRKMRLDSVIAGQAKRAQKIEDLLTFHPESSHKALHRALKGHSRKPHSLP
jgi:hypothetical protein